MSLIQVSDLTFSYDGSYDLIFDEASFQIDTDWKLGFVGRNGRGKTTFLKLLMGQMEYRGKIKADVEFDYFPFSVPNIEEDTIAVAYGIYPELEYWQLVRELSRLEMEEEALLRPFFTLSGGERTKVLLAVTITLAWYARCSSSFMESAMRLRACAGARGALPHVRGQTMRARRMNLIL